VGTVCFDIESGAPDRSAAAVVRRGVVDQAFADRALVMPEFATRASVQGECVVGGGHQHGSVHYERRDFEAIGIGRMEYPLSSQGRNILGSDLLQARIAVARVVSIVRRPASLGWA